MLFAAHQSATSATQSSSCLTIAAASFGHPRDRQRDDDVDQGGRKWVRHPQHTRWTVADRAPSLEVLRTAELSVETLHTHPTLVRSLHWIIITERIESSRLRTKFSQPPNLHNFITWFPFNSLKHSLFICCNRCSVIFAESRWSLVSLGLILSLKSATRVSWSTSYQFLYFWLTYSCSYYFFICWLWITTIISCVLWPGERNTFTRCDTVCESISLKSSRKGDFGASCEQTVHADDAVHFLTCRSDFNFFDLHNKLLIIYILAWRRVSYSSTT